MSPQRKEYPNIILIMVQILILGKMEDPLDIMKKGYRVTMILGIIGFPIICYNFLDYKGSWINFTFCGWIGITISYLFIEITRYYTDYNFGPVRKIVNVNKNKLRLVRLVLQQISFQGYLLV